MNKLMNAKHDILISNLEVANTFKTRACGLLGRSSLPENQALWIQHCNSIHTFFMKISIDCVFLSKTLEVKAIRKNVVPGRLVLPIWSADSVIEMSAGVSEKLGIKVGDKLYVGS